MRDIWGGKAREGFIGINNWTTAINFFLMADSHQGNV